MTVLPITSIFVAAACVMLVGLSLPVSLKRVSLKAPAGDAGDETLRRRIRAQGNFIEYAPLGLLALALIEFGGAGSTTVWGIGGGLAIGRVLHAIGMWADITAGKALGTLLTYLALLASAISLAMLVAG